MNAPRLPISTYQSMIRVTRLLAMGWRFHVVNFMHSGLFVMTSVIQPVIFASIAFFVFKSGHHSGSLLYAALGSGLMGVWSSTLYGSAGSIVRQRFQGTLEILVTAPVPFLLALLPLTLATASLGLYSIGATLAWGWLWFGISIAVIHPGWLAIAVPATVMCFGTLGLLMATTFVLSRYTSSFVNLLEYPVWLASGLLVPLALLPGWVRPLSWALGPTWGIEAIRSAVQGGDPGPPIAACAILAVGYLVAAAMVLRYFETLARRRATLPLS